MVVVRVPSSFWLVPFGQGLRHTVCMFTTEEHTCLPFHSWYLTNYKMPTFQSIRIALCNDYDPHGIPEFRDGSQDIRGSTFDVYAPIYQGSHLHVKYFILPPYPKSGYFLFKLFINGNHFVSWGTGPEDGYRGKVSFGLFDGGENDRGHTIIEKKALAFSQAWRDDAGHRQGLLEVKVHRANARRRIMKELETSDFPVENNGKRQSLVE